MNLLQYAEDRKVEYTQLSKWAGQGRFTSDALRKEGRRWMVADAQELDRQVAAAKAPDRGGRGGALLHPAALGRHWRACARGGGGGGGAAARAPAARRGAV
jgi:hypothetical protein